MPEKLEELIKLAYKKWKAVRPRRSGPHPDEEEWACFLEGKLAGKENLRIKAHLLECGFCMEILTTLIHAEPVPMENAPRELIELARNLPSRPGIFGAEIILKLSEKTLELLNTTADILVGSEFVPAPILRGRKIKEFKDEVTVLKDFNDIRVEIKIENKAGEAFDLAVFLKDKQTNRAIKDLRVSLFKDELELESYLPSSNKVTFEHVLAGKYTIEISGMENKMASILLDIRR